MDRPHLPEHVTFGCLCAAPPPRNPVGRNDGLRCGRGRGEEELERGGFGHRARIIGKADDRRKCRGRCEIVPPAKFGQEFGADRLPILVARAWTDVRLLGNCSLPRTRLRNGPCPELTS